MKLKVFYQQLRRSERKVGYLAGINVALVVCILSLSFSKRLHQGIAVAIILVFAYLMYSLFRKQHKKQRDLEDLILESYGEQEICFRKSGNPIGAQCDLYLWIYGVFFLTVFSVITFIIYQELHHRVMLSILLVVTHLLSVGIS
ncbi:MAG: hypothetical protein JW708_04470, partial [Vallitaleaceae bacterium]|nr:hypothetical protein [Vallitaleaceae bacterium]